MAIESFMQINPTLGEQAFVHPSALVIGQVSLADDVSIWPMAVVRGDVDAITIGQRTNIQDGSILHVTHYNAEYSPKGLPLSIGDDVTVGHRAVLHACQVGHRCLIGMGAIVMDEVTIQDDVMLGAGALVPPGKVLESGYLYMGSPVKRVRALTDKEKSFLRYSAQHYVALKNNYMR